MLILKSFSAPSLVRVKVQIKMWWIFFPPLPLFPSEFSGSLQRALWGVSSVQPHAVCSCSGLQGVSAWRDPFITLWPAGSLPHPGGTGAGTRCLTTCHLNLRNCEKSTELTVITLLCIFPEICISEKPEMQMQRWMQRCIHLCICTKKQGSQWSGWSAYYDITHLSASACCFALWAWLDCGWPSSVVSLKLWPNARWIAWPFKWCCGKQHHTTLSR